MYIETIEGEIIQYREVELNFSAEDIRFAIGATAADDEVDDIESMLAIIATHHAFTEVFMSELRDILRRRQ